MRRDLGDGYELDDDRDRVDVDAVHAYLSGEAYWAKGRPRTEVERLVRESQRVVGLYKDGAQVGYCRAASDGVSFAYLADVYVLPEHRGLQARMSKPPPSGSISRTSSGAAKRLWRGVRGNVQELLGAATLVRCMHCDFVAETTGRNAAKVFRQHRAECSAAVAVAA